MASRTVVGLDIGTTKICSIIANITDQGEFEVIGCGVVPSKGLKKGVIVNIEDASQAVAASLERAEIQAGFEVRAVFIGISGSHIEGINSKGVVAVTDKNKEIASADVHRAVDAAKAIVIPVDREVIHIIPQQYIVDDQDGIKDPVGMLGSRLEVIVHIITASATSLGNLVKSVAKAGFEATDIILEPLASAQAVLTEEEKDLGVALVDIGGGTTDYVIFEEGSLRHTGILPVGGNHITNDVALCLKTSNPSAEEIKIKYGSALSDYIDEDEEIEVPGLGGRNASVEKRKFLAEVIQPRIEEILSMVYQQLEKTGEKDYLAAGVVLTRRRRNDALHRRPCGGRVRPARTYRQTPWREGASRHRQYADAFHGGGTRDVQSAERPEGIGCGGSRGGRGAVLQTVPEEAERMVK